MRWLYPAVASLLVVHELDSAFWREWDLLGLPGGEPGFLLVHLPLLAAVFWGDRKVAAGRRAGAWASLCLAAAGLLAPAIHSAFLAAGRPEFRALASLSVLAATGLGSVLLAVAAVGALRSARRAPSFDSPAGRGV